MIMFGDFLQGNYVCKRCKLRFNGIKDISQYKEENMENGESETDQRDAKIKKQNICSFCLGALQTCLSLDAIDDNVIKPLNKSGHEFTSFILNISIPVSISITHQISVGLLESESPETASKDIPSVKDVWKWVVGSYIESCTGILFSFNSPFHIMISIADPQLSDHCNLLDTLHPEFFKNKKKQIELKYSHKNVTSLLSITSNEKIVKEFRESSIKTNDLCFIEKVEFEHDSTFLAGRYCKFSRELPQTPWIMDGKRFMESSVQELICTLITPIIDCSEIVFSSSGREDVDVRCLGEGRPFVLECINPKKITIPCEILQTLEKDINSSSSDISVRYLQSVSKDEVHKLKEGEMEKTKSYSCLCCSSSPLEQKVLDKLAEVGEVVLEQKTPVRVLHRRNLDTRKRKILCMSAKLVDANKFRLHLTSQAGTYIKEFVHGDLGRTVPSLSHFLGTETDIINLDVECVNIDWPKMNT